MARIDLGMQPGLPRLDEVSLNGSVLLFVALASLLAGALVGVLPAIACARPQRTFDALRASASTGLAGFNLFRRGRSRAVLVLIEVALAMVLLVGGGLDASTVSRGCRALIRVRSGRCRHVPDRVAAGQVSIAALKAFADEIVARMRRVPGVTAAAHGQPPMVILVDRFGLAAGRMAQDQPATMPRSCGW